MSAARRGLAGSAAVMFAGTAVSRVLGLVRNAVLALVLTVNVAGAANAFSVANKLPNIIYMLVAGGVLNAVLVPQIVRAMRREDGGQEYVDRLLTVAAAALAALTVVLTAGASVLVALYGRRLDEWYPLAVAFAFWVIPQLFFYGLYTLLGQVLNARSSFGPYMWAPAVNNVVAIAGLGVFIALYGTAATNDGADVAAWTPDRIALLAGTATLGVAAQALVLIIPLYRSGFRWHPRWGLRGTGLGRASRVALWAFAGLAVGQLGYLAVSNVAAAAATAGGGAADVAGNAAYDNAFLIYMLPQSLITVSLVTALFTRLSESAAAEDVAKVRADLSLGLRTVGVFTVFATAALAVLALPVVRVVLPTVTLAEARSVAIVTVAMLTGLAALGGWTLVQRVYYAFEDTRSLFFVQIPMSVIVAAGSVAGALLLEPRWWVPAAGLAMAVSTITGALVAYLRLRTRLTTLDGARVLRTHLRLGVAAGVAAGVGWGLLHLVGVGPGDEAGMSTVLVASLLRVAVVGSVMAAVYVLLLRLLRVSELDLLARPAVRLFSGVLRRVRTMTRGRGGSGTAGAVTTAPDETAAAAQDEAGDERDAETGDSANAPTPRLDPPRPQVEADHGVPGEEGAPVTEAATRERTASSGTVLAGRYRLTDPLTTDVPDTEAWRGHDTILDRPVQALLLGGEQTRDALDAARRAALVDDPRLVRILGVGMHEGSGFVVTDVVRGPDLTEVLAAGPLEPDQARAVVGELASALEAARRRGVHHLALRPSAVHLTSDGQVLVTGLGVDAAQRGVDGGDYWAASRADAVGLVGLLYLALTGVAPQGPAPTPPRDLRDVPADLSDLCTDTLTTEPGAPEQGPQNSAELIRALAPWTEIARQGRDPGDPGAPGPAADRAARRVPGLDRDRPAVRTSVGGADPIGTATAGATPLPVAWTPVFATPADGAAPAAAPPPDEAPRPDEAPPPDQDRTRPPGADSEASALAEMAEMAVEATRTWAPQEAPQVDDDARPPFERLLPAAPPAASGVSGVLVAPVVAPRHKARGGTGPAGAAPTTAADSATVDATTETPDAPPAAHPVADRAAALRRRAGAAWVAAQPAVAKAWAGVLAAGAASIAWLTRTGRSVGVAVVAMAKALAAPEKAPGRPDAAAAADAHGAPAPGRFDPTPYVLAIMLGLVLFGLIWAVETLLSAAGGRTDALSDAVVGLGPFSGLVPPSGAPFL